MKYLNESGLTYFWSKIVGYINKRYGNVDNTADSTKNVLSATKLTNARTINGVSFNGTANIVTPSISTDGNINLHADSDANTTTESAIIKAGHNELKVTSSGGGTTKTQEQDKLTFNGNVVYHDGNLPKSLPANGGNADTVGGKHASDFAQKEDIDNVSEILQKQIGSANGGIVNIINTHSGGLLLKELQGKSIQNGTPTTTTPADIISVGDDGSLVIRICKKNLIQNNAVTSTIGGVKFTVRTDKTVYASGTRTGTAVLKLQGDEQNVTFVLQKGITYKSFNQALGYKDINGNHGTIPVTGLTPAEDIKVTSIYIEVLADTVLPFTFYPMLYIGDTTAYERYEGQDTTIPLVQPLRSARLIYDKLLNKDGVWWIERKFGIEIFDGSDDENWSTLTTNSTGKYRLQTTKLKGKIKNITSYSASANMYCNRYKVQPLIQTSKQMEGIGVSGEGDIVIYDKNFTSSYESFYKTWLASNPLIVMYELATPTFEALPQQSQDKLNRLQTYDGQTNIFTTDKLQPSLSVEYGKTDVSAFSISINNKTNKTGSSNGGNADTVGGKHVYELSQKAFLVANNVDLFEYIESLTNEQFPPCSTVTIRAFNCKKSPVDGYPIATDYSLSNGGDFVIDVTRLENKDWYTLLAKEIPTNKIYRCIKHNNVWQPWRPLGDIIDLPVGTNIFDSPYVNTIMEWFTVKTYRIAHSKSAPLNFGYAPNNNDFYYTVYKLSNTWMRIIAMDVWTNRAFINTCNNGNWVGWQSVSDGGNAERINGSKITVGGATPVSPSKDDIWIY